MTDTTVTIDGNTTVVTGWRARLIGVVACLATAAFVAVVAIATAAGMLLVLPVAIGVGLVAALYRLLRP